MERWAGRAAGTTLGLRVSGEGPWTLAGEELCLRPLAGLQFQQLYTYVSLFPFSRGRPVTVAAEILGTSSESPLFFSKLNSSFPV